jgi:hypothetical protein
VSSPLPFASCSRSQPTFCSSDRRLNIPKFAPALTVSSQCGYVFTSALCFCLSPLAALPDVTQCQIQELCFHRWSVYQSVMVSNRIWGPKPDCYFFQSVAGSLMCYALSDEKTGLFFTIGAENVGDITFASTVTIQVNSVTQNRVRTVRI